MTQRNKTYLYDGSFNGFLTGIFESFERKEFDVNIVRLNDYQAAFFEDVLTVETNWAQSKRVWKGLNNYLNRQDLKRIYYAFLSENSKVIQAIFKTIQIIFIQKNGSIINNYGDEQVLLIDQYYTKVRRERHRMKAFIRFQQMQPNQYVAIIEPDFNVLPLIIKFFKERYADQHWLIFDTKRRYGALYANGIVEEVERSVDEKNALVRQQPIEIKEDDANYQRLWQQYFKSTNIEARKNTKLHLQHVPKRYWKYITEKRP